MECKRMEERIYKGQYAGKGLGAEEDNLRGFFAWHANHTEPALHWKNRPFIYSKKHTKEAS